MTLFFFCSSLVLQALRTKKNPLPAPQALGPPGAFPLCPLIYYATGRVIGLGTLSMDHYDQRSPCYLRVRCDDRVIDCFASSNSQAFLRTERRPPGRVHRKLSVRLTCALKFKILAAPRRHVVAP